VGGGGGGGVGWGVASDLDISERVRHVNPAERSRVA
jgi:hypothetical protein